MLNLDHHTKNSLQSKEKRYTLLPLNLLCDNNVTYREKSLLLVHFLHQSQTIKDIKHTHIASLALRFSNFKTNVPSRKLVNTLKSLERRGYISLIDQQYSILNPTLYQNSPKVAVNNEAFFRKDVGYLKLVLLFWLSCRYATDLNCTRYIAKQLNLDRNTASKYLNELEILKIIEPHLMEVNGKHTSNYHISKEYRPIFALKRKSVNNPLEKNVNSCVPFSAQLNYNFKKIINRLAITAKLEKIGSGMFTLSHIIDSKSKEVKWLIKAIRSNLYFKNKLVSEEEIKEKLKEIYIDLEENKVIKVFNNTAHFINFATMLFKTTSYPLAKALNDEILLQEIQKEVFFEKGENYSIDFIKWLATKLFAKDFVIYHVNIFKHRMVEALLNEKRTGEETDHWSESSYIDWDEIHRQEKRKHRCF